MVWLRSPSRNTSAVVTASPPAVVRLPNAAVQSPLALRIRTTAPGTPSVLSSSVRLVASCCAYAGAGASARPLGAPRPARPLGTPTPAVAVAAGSEEVQAPTVSVPAATATAVTFLAIRAHTAIPSDIRHRPSGGCRRQVQTSPPVGALEMDLCLQPAGDRTSPAAPQCGYYRGRVNLTPAQLAGVAQSLRHVAVLRYDAFEDMGGGLSLSCALVDDAGDGLVVASIHARGESRTYARGIVGGSSEITITPEEQKALRVARPGRTATTGRG